MLGRVRWDIGPSGRISKESSSGPMVPTAQPRRSKTKGGVRRVIADGTDPVGPYTAGTSPVGPSPAGASRGTDLPIGFTALTDRLHSPDRDFTLHLCNTQTTGVLELC